MLYCVIPVVLLYQICKHKKHTTTHSKLLYIQNIYAHFKLISHTTHISYISYIRIYILYIQHLHTQSTVCIYCMVYASVYIVYSILTVYVYLKI